MAVLIVIAVAGIVLFVLRGPGGPADTPVPADATQATASAMTAAAASAVMADSAQQRHLAQNRASETLGLISAKEANSVEVSPR